MPRIASIVLLGGSLIVLLGAALPNTRTRGTSSLREELTNTMPDDSGSSPTSSTTGEQYQAHRKPKAGPIASAGIVILLAMAAVSFEAFTTVSAGPIELFGRETTVLQFIVTNWLGAGVAVAGLVWLFYFTNVLYQWSARASTASAALFLISAGYEVFVLIPGL